MLFFKTMFFVVLAFSFSVQASLFKSFNPEKLKNDKEVLATVLDKGEEETIKNQYSLAYARSLFDVIDSSLREFNDSEKACDLGYAKIFERHAQMAGIAPSFYGEFFMILRAHNQIDDIFYGILKKSMFLHMEMKRALEDSRVRIRGRIFTPRVVKRNDVEKLFAGFDKWPDENEECSLGKYYGLAKQVQSKRERPKQRELELLNKEAYESGVIGEEVLERLQVLTVNDAISWPIYIGGYLEKVMDAKNTMQFSAPADLDDVDNIFASQYHTSRHNGRKEKITRRKDLYYKYNPTQIVMLAQVMERVSMRMGIDPLTDTSAPRIVTNYVVRRDGENREFSETYTLSPAEQMEFARKRLRMDMLDLNSSKIFKGINVEYEDIIVAALETGYITHHDLEYVVAFDDLWNPNVPKYKKYTDFLISIAGSAVFFLPPPWNVVGAIGMVFVNTKISNGKKGHENHENPNNVFN